MKTITKTIIYLQMTALFLTAALTVSGGSDKALPFRGSLQAVETYNLQFTTLFVDTSGSGNVTHLGRFTQTSEFEVDLLTFAASGSAHFIAANEDSIFTDIIYLGTPTPTGDPDVICVVGMHTITGGTGRFAGATGSFIEERLVNTVTGVTSSSLEGAIVIDKTK